VYKLFDLQKNFRDVISTKSQIKIYAEEIDEGQKENLRFHLTAKNLDKKDTFGKSDPFLNFYRLNLDGGLKEIFFEF